MNFVQLSSWDKKMKEGEDFNIEVCCNDESQASAPTGYAVNFQKEKTQSDGIIFHFNPRAPSSTVALNTLTDNRWNSEVKIIDTRVSDEYFVREKPFKLQLKVKGKKRFLVYVNDRFKTEYDCGDKDITETNYIVFSPFVTINRC